MKKLILALMMLTAPAYGQNCYPNCMLIQNATPSPMSELWTLLVVGNYILPREYYNFEACQRSALNVTAVLSTRALCTNPENGDNVWYKNGEFDENPESDDKE